MDPTEQSFKRRGHALVDQLPETADWKDLAFEASVVQDIEEGLRDSEAGRVTDNAIVRNQFRRVLSSRLQFPRSDPIISATD